MRRLIVIVLTLFLTFAFSGCNSLKKINGIYVLRVKNSQDVIEFSSTYEQLEFDGNGNFKIKSYYERTENLFYSYTSTYVGELTTNIEGQYYIKDNKIELEWFIGDKNYKEEFEFDENTIYKGTYYSDGKLNSKTILYDKLLEDIPVNLDGSYNLNLEKSKIPYSFSSAKYRKFIIDGKNFTFQDFLDRDTIKGELILGSRNAIIVDVDDFESYDPIIIDLMNNSLTIMLGNTYYLIYDIN